MFLCVLHDALCLYFCWKDVVCRCAVAPGSAVKAPAMTDEARATVGEKDEPMTKHIQAYKEANPTRAREGAENKPRRINFFLPNLSANIPQKADDKAGAYSAALKSRTSVYVPPRNSLM